MSRIRFSFEFTHMYDVYNVILKKAAKGTVV